MMFVAESYITVHGSCIVTSSVTNDISEISGNLIYSLHGQPETTAYRLYTTVLYSQPLSLKIKH